MRVHVYSSICIPYTWCVHEDDENSKGGKNCLSKQNKKMWCDVPWNEPERYGWNLHFMAHIISLLSHMEIGKFTRRRKQWKYGAIFDGFIL